MRKKKECDGESLSSFKYMHLYLQQQQMFNIIV